VTALIELIDKVFHLFAERFKTMSNNNQEKGSESIALHAGAVVGGTVMMVLGVGLSVTMVLLPIGIPLGLAGLGLCIWGLTPGWRK
jgi:hypothetical protein